MLGGGGPRYGARGDLASLVTLSCESLTLKTWVIMQDFFIYHEN